MEWQPNPDNLNELMTLLSNTQSNDNKVQQENNMKLNELRKVDDYINYLLYVLINLQEAAGPVRAVAGLLLKNNVRQDFEKIPKHVLEYVKIQSLEAIGDNDTLVRHTLGTVIATIVALGHISSWPEILPRLMVLLDSDQYTVVEGAWDILRKICEECTRELEEPFEDGTRPLNIMLPKFMTFFSSSQPVLREYAISTTTQFVSQRSESMQPLIDTFVVELFKRANDENPEVLKAVCRAVVALLESRPDKLAPELGNVVNYMLSTTQHSDPDIAMEACEFWLTFCELEGMVKNLEPFLNKVIPTLMHGMRYSEEDLLMLDNDDDDAVVPDSEQDIRPRHHRARMHDHHTEGQGTSANDGENSDDDDGDYEYDSDDDDDDVYAEWNLRKCSAASLDVMSTVFGSKILEFVLPVLHAELSSDDWREKEAGILALGAIAEGCMSGMEEHLGQLMPMLIRWFEHEKALVRSIACWTASRYGRWTVFGNEPNTINKYFEPLLGGLLTAMVDKNKRVQEAACSAFATVEEEAGPYMVPYIKPVLDKLMLAFSQYQRKNLIILYDAVGTLAEAVGSELNKEEYINMLMPQLLSRWESVQTEDQHMFPLFECLSAIALALGPGFKPFAVPVYQRCVQIVGDTLHLSQMASQDPTLEAPDKDLVIVALDLISAIIQALGPDAHALVATDNGVVLQLVGLCMMDPVTDVRQSAFALLGDLAMHSFSLLLPQLSSIMQQLIPQIDRNYSHINVCNNAAWSAGEIALKAGNEIMATYVPELVPRLILLLNNPATPATLAENAAITLGRLGAVCPQLLAPSLHDFAERWCQVLTNVRDNEEKASAFHGFMAMISANPAGISAAFPLFCQAALNWQTLDQPLEEVFQQTFAGLRQIAGESWESNMAMFDPRVRDLIRQRFNV